MIRDAAPPSVRATRVRDMTSVYAMLVAVIMYLDSVCIAQAAPSIRYDLGLSLVQMSWALAAINWACALFEIPGGWLGDLVGPRRVLTRVVLWWSFFTLHRRDRLGLERLVPVVTRALFGAGEAGCFPNLTRVFTVGGLLPVVPGRSPRAPVREGRGAGAIARRGRDRDRRVRAVGIAGTQSLGLAAVVGRLLVRDGEFAIRRRRLDGAVATSPLMHAGARFKPCLQSMPRLRSRHRFQLTQTQLALRLSSLLS